MSVLRDKVYIVTGASSGLGEALAFELASRGVRLALFSPEAERQREVAERCRLTGVEAIAVIGDVTRPEDCRRLVDVTVAQYGRLDGLVANAGISMWARFREVEDLALFRKLIEVNYLGAVHCIHPALEQLIAAEGMIVAITSIQARIGVPAHTGYVASKHALQGFCDSLRMELDGTGVGVLTILPHWIRGTELRRHAFAGDGRELGEGSRKHSKESITVDAAARSIVDAIVERRRELVMPWKLKLLVALNLLSPKLAESIIRGAVDKQDRGH